MDGKTYKRIRKEDNYKKIKDLLVFKSINYRSADDLVELSDMLIEILMLEDFPLLEYLKYKGFNVKKKYARKQKTKTRK